MLRHAYLIVAHNDWELLKILIELIDSSNHDIYIHIDKKSKNVPVNEISGSAKESGIFIYQEYKVYWGGYSIVQAEMLLLKNAYLNKYDYYHILSGADLPIQSKDYIDTFFEKNRGKEFIAFYERNSETIRRTKYYHFLQNYRRRFKIQFFNEIFTFLERSLLLGQMIIHIDRMRKFSDIEIMKGSQWCSITHEFVEHVLGCEQLIEKVFRYTSCADELFLQTIVWNSKFKEKLFQSKDIENNLRLIDWTRGVNGNPYTFKKIDFDLIKNSKCLFARKFNTSVDKAIINEIYNNVCNKEIT